MRPALSRAAHGGGMLESRVATITGEVVTRTVVLVCAVRHDLRRFPRATRNVGPLSWLGDRLLE